ncbi:MAG: glycosyltransferase [Methanospirillum sp.]
MKVLMCGSIADSGGESTHTKQVISNLVNLGVAVDLYGIRTANGTSVLLSNCRKIIQRTAGIFYYTLRKREDFDILHIQSSGGLGSFVSGVTGVIAGKLCRKPVIITFHYSKTLEFIESHRRVFKFVLENATKLILVSGKQLEAVKKTFPEFASKLEQIPNGFDPEVFFSRNRNECRKILNVPLDKTVIFNISNLTKSKGHRFLIEAIHEIPTSDNDVVCYIAGKGEQYSQLVDQIGDYNLQDRISLLGWIPDEQIPIWLNACDFFVMPSCAEGNPIVMFECLGCGTPYVGTSVGGVPEIIISNQYGLLVKPGDITDLAEKIIAGMSMEWDRTAILRHAGQYTWENIAIKIMGIYSDMSTTPA